MRNSKKKSLAKNITSYLRQDTVSTTSSMEYITFRLSSDQVEKRISPFEKRKSLFSTLIQKQ